MLPKDEKLSKWLSGVAGEYFVAAELSRRGYIAAVTMRNTRGLDLLVSRPGSKRALTLQVKTIQSGNSEWLLSKPDEESKGDAHFYAFVALNRLGDPEYFLVSGKRVAKECTDRHIAYITGTKKDGTPRKDTTMRTFCPRPQDKGAWESLAVAMKS
ncbi:MAG: hypothetical protein Q8L55_00020 [Phycisphaerales bacterium]|nr:hypothetical protein [Phycisphaerales bacterium]